jgi:hypothetical protein
MVKPGVRGMRVPEFSEMAIEFGLPVVGSWPPIEPPAVRI